MPFHQPGTGRQKNVNFTQKLILNILLAQLPNTKGFFTTKKPNAKAFAIEITLRTVWLLKPLVSGSKGTHM